MASRTRSVKQLVAPVRERIERVAGITITNLGVFSTFGNKQIEVSVQGRLFANSLPAVRAAAVAGFGVARLPLYLARDEIAAGRLQIVLPGWATPSRPVHLVYLKTRHPSARVRSVVQFLLQCAKDRRFDG